MTEEYKNLTDDERLKKASEILDEHGVELPIQIARFGRYTQYELAGEDITFNIELESLNDDDELEDVPEDIIDLVEDLISSVIDEDYAFDIYGNLGQNILVLDQNGEIDSWEFTI